MFKLKTHLKSHKSFYLAVLVLALFAAAILLFSRLVGFGQFSGALRGSLIQANPINRTKILTPVTLPSSERGLKDASSVRSLRAE